MSSPRFMAAPAILLFAIITCGSGCSSPAAAPSPSPSPTPNGPSVEIPSGASSLGDRAYAPDDLTVDAGTTVTWINGDSVTHTSTSDGTGWNSGSVAPGHQFSFMFQTPGTFTYHCTIHPGMVGTVVVR